MEKVFRIFRLATQQKTWVILQSQNRALLSLCKENWNHKYLRNQQAFEFCQWCGCQSTHFDYVVWSKCIENIYARLKLCCYWDQCL